MEKFKVNFADVEESGSYDIPNGKYKVRVEEIELKDGDKAKYLLWKLKIMSGTAAGMHINHITSLSPNALFALRDTLVAMGINVPKAAVNIDPDKFIGKTFGIEVIQRTHEGKEYPNVKKTFPLSEFSEFSGATSAALGTSAGDELPLGIPSSKTSGVDEISIDLG